MKACKKRVERFAKIIGEAERLPVHKDRLRSIKNSASRFVKKIKDA